MIYGRTGGHQRETNDDVQWIVGKLRSLMLTWVKTGATNLVKKCPVHEDMLIRLWRTRCKISYRRQQRLSKRGNILMQSLSFSV